MCAFPESINAIPTIKGDSRTPEKLIDGINYDHTGKHSWLAPIIPKHLNRLYIVMDQPTNVSSVMFWNYSKTPERGIKDFGVSRFKCSINNFLKFDLITRKYITYLKPFLIECSIFD